jgi:hypothetical protein
MEREELLLKDLSARLPYKTLISINGEKYRMEEIRNALIGIDTYKITIDGCDIECTDIKPYLFPLSSMTERQKKEYYLICSALKLDIAENEAAASLVDWYHKNHFDWRGLIPKDLAIDATGLNIY